MAPRSWRRTVDIECRDFPAGTASSDVANWVTEFFVNSYPQFKIKSIQQASGRVARVTFDKECVEAKETIEALDEVTIHGVQCLVLKPEPSAPRLQHVLVYQYPYEFPNDSVATVLDKFGAVKEVLYQHWTNLPEVSTGTRIVRMVLDKDIPRFLFIRGIRCKVWYRDQPLTCDICSKGGHKASACPDKGKCLRCHKPGHVARHCPTPWGAAGGAGNAASASGASGAGGGETDVSGSVAVDPGTLLPAGDLSQGLQHADDLDAGFTSLADDSIESDHDLAAAASVAEAVLNFSPPSNDCPDPEVVVVDDGVATPSVSSSFLDERFNQLDEIASQASVSILSNCGPVGAPSGGEFADSQNSLNLSNDSDNNVKLSNENDNNVNLSNENDNNVNLSNDNDGLSDLGSINDINCYGSVVAPDGASPGPQIVDSEMSDSVDPRKRPILEDVSSDGTSGDSALISKSLSKKPKKAGVRQYKNLCKAVYCIRCRYENGDLIFIGMRIIHFLHCCCHSFSNPAL